MIHLDNILANSLIILCIHALFWPGMLLFPLRKYLDRLPVVIKKPVFDCMICMASVWGLIFFLYANGLSLSSHYFYCLIPHILAVCGLNVILDSVVYYWRRGGNRLMEIDGSKDKLL